MYVVDLVAEPDREAHLARHNVTMAEGVALGGHVDFRTRHGYYGLVGQTYAGRYLTVIVVPLGGGIVSLVTARDADQAERRLFQRRRGG